MTVKEGLRNWRNGNRVCVMDAIKELRGKGEYNAALSLALGVYDRLSVDEGATMFRMLFTRFMEDDEALCAAKHFMLQTSVSNRRALRVALEKRHKL